MSEFESVKHSFIGGSILFILLGVFYLILGFGASIINAFLVFLPIIAVLVFAIWMKKNNPLYKLDRASRKNLIKAYQWQWGERHKVLLTLVFTAVIFVVFGISLLLGADYLQAVYFGLGFPLMIYGLVSLTASNRMQPKAD